MLVSRDLLRLRLLKISINCSFVRLSRTVIHKNNKIIFKNHIITGSILKKNDRIGFKFNPMTLCGRNSVNELWDPGGFVLMVLNKIYSAIYDPTQLDETHIIYNMFNLVVHKKKINK